MSENELETKTSNESVSDPLGRRRFLGQFLGATSLLAVSGCSQPVEERVPASGEQTLRLPEKVNIKAAALLPDALNPLHFHVHNRSPLALEAKRSALGRGVITPLSRFFVRNNLPRPDDKIVLEADRWELEVEGVARPGPITLAELKTLGLDTEAAVIQCSGNGRDFFTHGASGSQWATGAAGCAIWTGVRVSTVLKHFGGAVSEAHFLTSTGGEDLPEGVERNLVVVERSVPLDKGMKDCLLAWEMNGQPVPITHGGPLRLIVPGYFGCNNIKYVKTIAATKAETTAKIQAKGYRFRPIGEKGGPSHPTMWRMPVKSWVNGPGADAQAVLGGQVLFHGVAFSGERGVKKVEVSMDGGAQWEPADLHGPDLGPNAWRQFVFQTDLKPGRHTIISRATDTFDEVQLKERTSNERGYGHTGWLDHALDVEVVASLKQVLAPANASEKIDAAAKPAVVSDNKAELSEAGKRGKKVFTETSDPQCGVCHTVGDAGSAGLTGPNLDELKPDFARVQAAVTNGVGVMPPFGESLRPDQIKDLATYIVEATTK